MTDKKLTDEDVVEGLERCISTTTAEACEGCPFNKQNLCDKDQWALERYALDLIKRQKSEIERLKGSTIVNNIMESRRIKREAKAAAFKEFAERLKLHSYIMNDESQTGIINRYSVVTVNQIDNLLKEMVGEEE